MQVKSDMVPKLLTETLIPQNGKPRKPFLALQRPCQPPISGIALHGNQKDAFFNDKTDWMCVSDKAWAVCVSVGMFYCREVISHTSSHSLSRPESPLVAEWSPVLTEITPVFNSATMRRGPGPVDYLLSPLRQRTPLSAPTSPSEHNNTNAGEPQSSCTVGQ